MSATMFFCLSLSFEEFLISVVVVKLFNLLLVNKLFNTTILMPKSEFERSVFSSYKVLCFQFTIHVL